MNFRGIISIFNSQGLKSESSSVISSGSETYRKENQLQRHPIRQYMDECRNFDSEKTVVVSCSSYKPPPQTFDQQKFEKEGANTPQYTVKWSFGRIWERTQPPLLYVVGT